MTAGRLLSLCATISILLACTPPAHGLLERQIRANTLTSRASPPVRLRFDDAYRYVGGQRFVLNSNADVEQHFFVDADANGRIRRLYWIQFEQFLPTVRGSFDYAPSKTVSLGGLEFIADAYVRIIQDEANPTSDGARARAFLATRGIRFSRPEIISQRLVHIPDAERRQELMIIYSEELAPLGIDVRDLPPDGTLSGPWTAVADTLLRRATDGMKLAPLGSR